MNEHDGESMEDLTKFSEMIPEYMLGRLNSGERAEFEDFLNESSELREELLSYRRLQGGLELYERISTDHVSSEILSAYGANPEALSKTDLDRTKAHLAECPSCRDDLAFCSVSQEVPVVTEASNPVASFVRWLMSPGIQPMMVAALVVLVAIPTFYLGFRDTEAPGAPISFIITPVDRDGTPNPIVIQDNTPSIFLTGTVAVKDGAVVCVLVDEAGKVEHEWESIVTHNQFDLELSTSYLDEGNYRLNIRELGSSDKDNGFVFRLQVTVD